MRYAGLILLFLIGCVGSQNYSSVDPCYECEGIDNCECKRNYYPGAHPSGYVAAPSGDTIYDGNEWSGYAGEQTYDTAIPGKDGIPVIRPDQCTGAIVNGICTGGAIDNDGWQTKCYGAYMNGKCTGPMF